MKKIILNSLLSSALVFLAGGCASLSKEECLMGDWKGIGFRDGVKGEKAVIIEKYMKDCGKAGAKVDREAYMTARTEGLKTYCTPKTGFEAGKNGYSLFTECPESLRGNFQKGHSLGLEIGMLNSRLKSVEGEMAKFEKKLDDPATSPSDKLVYRSRLRELQSARDEQNRGITKAEIKAEALLNGLQ